MIDADTFRKSVKEMYKFSERLGDGWIFHDNENIPESAFINKKLKVQIISEIFTFEYHIMFNFNYSVPTLLFNVHRTDGAPITNIEECQQLLNTPKLERNILMQQEHPSLHVPFFTFHPCKTGEIMEVFAGKTKNPVVSWISVFGSYVHLNIPMEYSELT